MDKDFIFHSCYEEKTLFFFSFLTQILITQHFINVVTRKISNAIRTTRQSFLFTLALMCNWLISSIGAGARGAGGGASAPLKFSKSKNSGKILPKLLSFRAKYWRSNRNFLGKMVFDPRVHMALLRLWDCIQLIVTNWEWRR